MTQPNLTEMVARAIWEAFERPRPFEEMSPSSRSILFAEATAAISAAREAIRAEAIANLELCQQCGARREPRL